MYAHSHYIYTYALSHYTHLFKYKWNFLQWCVEVGNEREKEVGYVDLVFEGKPANQMEGGWLLVPRLLVHQVGTQDTEK